MPQREHVVPLSTRVFWILNPGVQIGMFLFGFGSIFFWFIATRADLSSLGFHWPYAQANGIVVKVTVDNPAARSQNRFRIIDYTYSIDGRSFQGVAYNQGKEVVPGQQVIVYYSKRNPAWSKVQGMRHDLYSPLAFLVTIFPLLGLWLIARSMREGIRRIHQPSENEMRPMPLAALLSVPFPAFVIFMNLRALWRHLG